MKQRLNKTLWGIGLLLGMLTGCASNQIDRLGEVLERYP